MSLKRFLAVLFIVGFVVSCSLSLRPRSLTFTLNHSPATRGLRALSDLDVFALVVSGGLSDNVSAQDVGGRSLECLYLNGQVTFPLTLAQLTSGVSLALASGTYRFSVVGFDSLGVASPASIAELFANSPILEEYLVAQTTADTSQSGTVTLNSTFSHASTPNQLPQCPAAATVLHGLISQSGQVQYLKGIDSQWSLDTVSDVLNVDNGALAIGANGVAHVSYGRPTSGQGIRYANNSLGAFTSLGLVDDSSTNAQDYSGIAVGSNNSIEMATNDYSGIDYYAAVYSKVSTNWNLGVNALSAVALPLTSLDLLAGPNTTLSLFATSQAAVSPLYIAQRSASGVWTSTQISTATPATCSASIIDPDGAYDSQGYAHVAYLCMGPGFRHIGYATNRSGSWVNSQVTTVPNNTYGVARLAIDGSGGMHVIYQQGTLILSYQSGSVSTGIWNSPTNLLAGSDVVSGKYEIAALGAGEVHAIVMRDNGVTGRLTYLTNRTGSWVPTIAPDDYSPTATILHGFYAR